MQKKLLTAAVASVLAAPCIALAQTAASVEVYGTVYPTFGHVKYGDGFTARDIQMNTGLPSTPAQAISVPAIFCYTFFRNRLVRVTLEVGNLADDLLTQMYHQSQNEPADEVEHDTKEHAAA